MGKLLILNLADGDQIAEKLTNEMKAFSGSVVTKSLNNWDQNEDQTGSVTVVIISSLVCQDLNRIAPEVWTKLLIGNENTLLLICCRHDGESSFLDLCERLNIEESALRKYNVNRDETEWFMAESQLKIMLNSLDRQKSTLVPQERRFMIRPGQIKQDTSEVTVVLFEDYPQTRAMSAVITHTTSGDQELRKGNKIRNGVWTLDTKDLKTGDYAVQICMDDIDIGEAILSVKNDMDVITETLNRVMLDDPKGLLSRLLQLNENSFDESMACLLKQSASEMMVKLFRGLSNCGSPDNEDSSTLLHFLKKYGCIRSLEKVNKDMLYRNRKSPWLQEVNYAGRPVQHAMASDADSDEEVFAKTTSPLGRSLPVRHPRTQSMDTPQRDSGFSTGSSTGSEGKTNPSSTLTRWRLPSDRSMRVSIAVAEQQIKEHSYMRKTPSYQTPKDRHHVYEEIQDRDPAPTPVPAVARRPSKTETLYDLPWEESPLPKGEMPKRPGQEREAQSTTL